jgi:ribosomal-protein-alanine N-acetyltransferase
MIFDLRNFDEVNKERVIEEIAQLEREIFGDSSLPKKELENISNSPRYLTFVDIEINSDIVNNEEYTTSIIKESIINGVIFNNQIIKGYLIILDCIDCYEIIKIATKVEFRGQGVGKTLLDKLKELCNNEDKNIFLEVRESNQVARNFYIKENLQEINVRKGYYSNGESAIIMMFERS